MQDCYEHRFEVAETDIDGLGHANNIEFVRWIQDVAVAHSSAVGLDFAAYVAMASFFVVRRHEVDYLRPALRGDPLVVRTWIDSAAAAQCERVTEIVRETDGAMLARATTTWGFVEATSGRPTRIPDAVRAAFGLPQRPSSRAAVAAALGLGPEPHEPARGE